MLHRVAAPTVELAGDLPTLAFCVTVNHAERLAEVINRYKHGSARHLSGKASKEERRAAPAALQAGPPPDPRNGGPLLQGLAAANRALTATARAAPSPARY